MVDKEIEAIHDQHNITVIERLDNNEKLKQILEMDEPGDEEKEFSKNIVAGFFQQAATTYKRIKDELPNAAGQPDKLREISNLAEFIRGSAATIGFDRIEYCCQRIVYAGKLEDPDDNPDWNKQRRQISAKQAQDSIDAEIQKLRRRILAVMWGAQELWDYDFQKNSMDGPELGN